MFRHAVALILGTLTLLGCTKPQSRLRDGVPETVRLAGSPPPPVLQSPDSGATFLTGEALAFAWNPGAGTPTAQYFDLCVTEINQTCNHANAWVANNLPPQMTSLTATGLLPFRFQGKRLRWTVSACATAADRLAGGSTILCTPAPFRTLNWPLPGPELSRPQGSLDHFRPDFAWSIVPGAQSYLFCVSAPGVACPLQSHSTADTLVVTTSNTTSYMPASEDELLRFVGRQVNWTAAACNAELGCSYQQNVWSITFPPLPWRLSPRRCDTADQCGGGVCDDGFCRRLLPTNDSYSSAAACEHAFEEEDCQHGRFCLPQADGTKHCASKYALDVQCVAHDQCISGFCDQASAKCAQHARGSYLTAFAVVDRNRYPALHADPAHVRATVAAASDLLYEKTGHRITMLEPTRFETLPSSPSSAARVQHMVNQRHAILSRGTVHSALAFDGPDANPSPGERGSFTYVKPTIVTGLFCNQFGSAISRTWNLKGEEVIHISRMSELAADPLEFGHVYVHELLHNHGGHLTEPCKQLMGDAMADAHVAALRFYGGGTHIHEYDAFWDGICPSASVFVANSARHSACPGAISTGRLEGESCAQASECQSGLCGSAPGSSVKRCMSATLSAGSACLADAQCAFGLECNGLRCTPPYTGPALALGATCEFRRQCGPSRACLPQGQGASATTVCANWNQSVGAACTLHRECQSEICGQGQCRAGNLTNGQSCAVDAQCNSGFCGAGVCANRTVGPNEQCVVDEQCEDGKSCALIDVNGTRRCKDLSSQLGEQCFDNTNIGVDVRCEDQGNSVVLCRKAFIPAGQAPTSNSQIVGTCVNPPLPNGSACISNNHCQSGNCSFVFPDGGQCL